MIELTILVTLITLMLIGMRTKPRQLENPVVIERGGNYRVTLAPRLNLAITFIERIAQSYRALPAPPDDSATLCLTVHDPSLKGYGIESYLLAVTLRGGLLHFQALLPSATAGTSRHRQLDEFVQAALKGTQAAEVPQQTGQLLAAAEQAASASNIRIERLLD